jgi:diguanylate cyclase (GGDEF)-like protein
MYSAVFMTWRQAAAFTSAVGLAYLIVVLLDGTGVIPHHWYLPQGPDRYRDTEFLVTTSVAFVGVLATITFWMVFIGSELRREKETALKANAELVSAQSELRQLNEELEQKVALRTEALVWRAEHDPLTGLLNRGTVTRRLQDLLALERRGGRPLAVIVVDADNFKVCNDTAGHAYGDEVLRAIAECLEGSGRESDVAGRLGGDEFLIVLPDTGERGALRFCRRLLKRTHEVRSGWTLAGPPLPTVSLGVALFPDHGGDVDELVRVADHAMYRAKADGGDGVAFGNGESTFPRPLSPARRGDAGTRG